MGDVITRADLLAAAKRHASDAPPSASVPDVASRAYQALVGILCALDDLGYADPVQIADVRAGLKLERLFELSADPCVSRESQMLIQQYLSQAKIRQATPRALRAHVPVQVYATQLMVLTKSGMTGARTTIA